MQQKQNKTEASTKKNNSFGKMMLQKDKNGFQMKEKQAYIELLKEPRGKEYFRLLGKIKEVAKQLADVDEQIEKLKLEIEQAEKQEPKADTQEENLSWLTDAPKGSDTSWLTDTPKKEDTSWLGEKENGAQVLQQIEEKKQKLLQLQREESRLAEEFRKEQEAFLAQLPAPERCFQMIWPEVNEHILLKYGAIGCPGTSFDSPEELLEIAKPQTEQEKRQILKGNDAYQTYIAQYGEFLLVVEIYMDAICVVLMDGRTIVIE